MDAVRHLIDWKGRDWTPDSPEPAAHPNSRFATPAGQCPIIAPEWDDPSGVPISAILFGGRRASTVPPVTESFDWDHGGFLGVNIASEKTAAAEGVDTQAWKLEAEHIHEHFETFRRHLPARLRELHQELAERLG
jgi:GTP-dependent phosphoenolpyruvate carboxykinase